jgi:DNA-binding NarL/FixJ family response regulator
MTSPIRVRVHASDCLSEAGVTAELKQWPEVSIVADADEADVAIVVADDVDRDTVRMLRAAQRGDGDRAVLVATRIDDRGLLEAVEAGACGVVRRSDANGQAIVAAVRTAARGDGTLPSDLLGRLLTQVGKLQRQVLAPHGLSFGGLSEREVAVLRLVADGLDTGEIAQELAYSERTIKNVIHDVTTRLHLRNRSQAVAYALREGLI